MGQIVSFHPKSDGLTRFYEVLDIEERAIWGGESANEAIKWWRKYAGARMLLSTTEGEGEDLTPIGLPVDLTPVLRALINEVVGK